MTSPVQAVLAERVAAISMFENWCRSKGVCACPATPATVGAFAADCEILGLDKLVEIVAAISNIHTSRGLADPTFGQVSAELNRISGIGVPRSWSKEHWPIFKGLPYPLQVYLIENGRVRDNAVRQAQNEVATLRQKLAALKEKEAA